MGITANFNLDEIDEMFSNIIDEMDSQIIETFQHAGEIAISFARQPHAKDWHDQTHNLRSSIGYTIFRDGVAISGLFEAINGGEEGVAEGKRLAQSVGKDTKGIALVVVAGMRYAIFVESKGYDVLTGAELEATKHVSDELKDMEANILKALKEKFAFL